MGAQMLVTVMPVTPDLRVWDRLGYVQRNVRAALDHWLQLPLSYCPSGSVENLPRTLSHLFVKNHRIKVLWPTGSHPRIT